MCANPYINVKITEEAKLAATIIRDYHMPGTELQEVYSMAIMEYLHAYHQDLEPIVSSMLEARQQARRGKEAD